MKRVFVRILIFLTCLSLVACKTEDPNPELRDPIYLDLEKRSSDYTKELEGELKTQVTVREKISKTEPGTIEMKNVMKELEKSLKASKDLEQKARYYTIRAKRRKLEDKINYHAAFVKGQDWPDKTEYSEYLVNKRLHEVNLNWNSRVPKLQNRAIAAKKVEKEGEKAKSGGGGH